MTTSYKYVSKLQQIELRFVLILKMTKCYKIHVDIKLQSTLDIIWLKDFFSQTKILICPHDAIKQLMIFKFIHTKICIKSLFMII